ncbi:MAG: hypothetical protein ACO33B_01700 [Ilumatobacteraceae bacterium]
MSAGAAHTCALLDDSTVKCWGNGADGRLGYENANDIGDDAGEVGNSLQAVSLGTGRTAVAISAGAQHTCAVLDDASLKCWGKGTNGRRGSDSTTSAGSTAGTMGDSLAIVAFSTGRTVSVVESTTTTTTTTTSTTSTTTTTTVAPTTSTSSTTAAPTTTTAPATTAAPTTTAAPAPTAAPSGGGESAPPVVVASPISTTSSSTSTTIQPTTTTSVVPTSTTTPVVERVRSLGVLILPPFRTGSFELNTAQKNRLGRYSVRLRAGDRVTCTAYQAGSPTFVSQLSLRRAQSVCAYQIGRASCRERV